MEWPPVLLQMLRDERVNVFHDMDDADRQFARRLMIDMVLGTDMSHHFEDQKRFDIKVEAFNRGKALRNDDASQDHGKVGSVVLRPLQSIVANAACCFPAAAAAGNAARKRVFASRGTAHG